MKQTGGMRVVDLEFNLLTKKQNQMTEAKNDLFLNWLATGWPI